MVMCQLIQAHLHTVLVPIQEGYWLFLPTYISNVSVLQDIPLWKFFSLSSFYACVMLFMTRASPILCFCAPDSCAQMLT